VTGPSTAKPYPEARPPHLPDAVARQSPLILFFLAVVVVQLWRLAATWPSAATGIDARSTVEYALSWLPSLAAPLAGVALLFRQPDARRTMGVLVFGLSLLSLGELLSVFQGPIRDLLRGLGPIDEAASPYDTPAEFAFRVFTLLLTIFGLLYLGAGLAAARVRERTAAERPLTIWLAALAIVGSVVSLAALTSIASEATPTVIVQVIIGAILSAVVTFAWAYVAVVTISGWIAREAPRRAWGIGALGAGILFAFRLIFPALSLVPFGPESSPFLTVLAYVSWTAWLLIIVAFVIGLPSGATPTDATADPRAATSPGSGAG
jgi:hypothetical protein